MLPKKTARLTHTGTAGYSQTAPSHQNEDIRCNYLLVTLSILIPQPSPYRAQLPLSVIVARKIGTAGKRNLSQQQGATAIAALTTQRSLSLLAAECPLVVIATSGLRHHTSV